MSKKKKNNVYVDVESFCKEANCSLQETQKVKEVYYQSIFAIVQKGVPVPKVGERVEDPLNKGKFLNVQKEVELYKDEKDGDTTKRILTPQGEAYFKVVDTLAEKVMKDFLKSKDPYHEIYKDRLFKIRGFIIDAVYSSEQINNRPISEKLWKVFSDAYFEGADFETFTKVLRWFTKEFSEVNRRLTIAHAPMSTKILQAFLNEKVKDTFKKEETLKILIWRLQRQFQVIVDSKLLLVYGALAGKQGKWVYLDYRYDEKVNNKEWIYNFSLTHRDEYPKVSDVNEMSKDAALALKLEDVLPKEIEEEKKEEVKTDDKGDSAE